MTVLFHDNIHFMKPNVDAKDLNARLLLKILDMRQVGGHIFFTQCFPASVVPYV
jgi:hypothetical protein